MKEAISNSVIMGIVLTFMAILILILSSSSAYSKASKVRNRILEMIEYNQGYGEDDKSLLKTPDLQAQIDAELANYGYRINNNAYLKCKSRQGSSLDADQDNNGSFQVNALNNDKYSKYSYCVYKFKTDKGVYYGVETYMYFDIPLLDQIQIGIYGEGKTMYDLDKFKG